MTLRRSLCARPEIIRGEQCTTGAFARANGGGEGSGGVVADIAKLSVGQEAYYTRELATDHQAYLSGHGESPGPLVRRRRRRPWAGGRSIRDRVPGHVRRPPPHDQGTPRPPAWPQRRARLRCGAAADQERLGPLWPGEPTHRTSR